MRVIQQLNRRLNNIMQRGSLTLIDDDKDIQELQVSIRKDQLREGREHPTNYGFTHHPPKGLEDIVLMSQGGNTSKGMVIVVGDRKYRMKGLKEGEVALYDDLEQHVHLTRDGIVITSSKKLTVDTPESIFTGNVTIKKNLTVEKDTDIKGNLTVKGTSTLEGAVNALVSVTTKVLSATTSVSSAAITATAALMVAGKNMLTHTHGGVKSGTGSSGGPE